MTLTQHFTLREIESGLGVRQTIARRGIDNRIPLAYPDDLQTSLKPVQVWLLGCERVLEPLRARLDRPIIVSCGYRCDKLNLAVGGSQNSQHTGIFGNTGPLGVHRKLPACAFDLEFSPDHGGNLLLFQTALLMGRAGQLDFDQLIWEYDDGEGPAWVHISHTPTFPGRKQILRTADGKTYKNV